MTERTLTWRWAGWLTLAALVSFSASAQPFQLISRPDSSKGPSISGGGDSAGPVISADGRFVLFASTANNLVLTGSSNPIPALFPAKLNVFLRDRSNAATSLISVNLAGTGGGSGDSLPVGISKDGRYVLFESSASDLVPNDTNEVADVFIRELMSGTTSAISVGTNGTTGNGPSHSPTMTPDGRFVAFVSEASDLVTADTNGIPDLFVRDRLNGQTSLASVGAASAWPPLNSGLRPNTFERPDLTPDGRYLTFFSTATNLVPGVTNVGDVYVRDLVSRTTIWVSRDARTAVQTTISVTNIMASSQHISDDGKFVAYEASSVDFAGAPPSGVLLRYSLESGLTETISTNASVLTRLYEETPSLSMSPDGRFIAFLGITPGVGSGTNTCVYLWDAQSGTAALVSEDLSNGLSTNGVCDLPVVDSSGRFVAFLSTGLSLVTNTVSADFHLYLRDLQTGSTSLIDSDANGAALGPSPGTFQLTPDGRFIAFDSPSASLVPDDSNHGVDVFVRDQITGAVELVSARDAILPSLTANGASAMTMFSVSSNGQFVAFASDADDLVPGDTNGFRDVFVRDVVNGTNLLLSVSTNGLGADGISTDAAISGDGRYVAFTSSADNLVPSDSNKAEDVFVRDLQGGTTVLVSISTNGITPGNTSSHNVNISADGTYVLFSSKAINLAAGAVSNSIISYDEIYLRNVRSRRTYALTRGTFGKPVAAMTPDGHFVGFYGNYSVSSYGLFVWNSQSAAVVYSLNASSALSANLSISPDGNRVVNSSSSGFYALDRAANARWQIGPGLSGNSSAVGRPGLRFSKDSRYLVYATSVSQNAGDTNDTYDIYLYDFQNRSKSLISRSYFWGGAANARSDSPDISPDSRFVAYRSFASDIVPGDTNGVPDIFLYDRSTGTTTLLSASQSSNSTADNRSFFPVFSGEGQMVVFASWASDLAAQDFNQGGDLFAYQLYSSAPIPLFQAQMLAGPTADQGARISWPTLPGKTYYVQFKNSLSDADWQAVSSGVTIVGSQGYFTDFIPRSNQRFYRIVAF